MPDISNHSPGAELTLAFGIKGPYTGALDGMITPSYDLASQVIEYEDEVDYFWGGTQVAAVAAQFGVFLFSANLPLDNTKRMILDRVIIANTAAAADTFAFFLSPGVGTTPNPCFRRNHKRQGQADGVNTPVFGTFNAAAQTGTQIGGRIAIPAGATVDLPWQQLLEAVQGTTPIFGIWSGIVNLTFDVSIFGRVVQIAK